MPSSTQEKINNPCESTLGKINEEIYIDITLSRDLPTRKEKTALVKSKEMSLQRPVNKMEV